MSESILSAVKREGKGKSFARTLRWDGKIPGVFYIQGEAAQPLTFEKRALLQILSSNPALIKLQFDDGSSREAVIREVQKDPLSGEVRHIDMLGIKRGVKLHVTVPIKLTGEAAGLKEGGILDQQLREIEIECLPKDIPNVIEVDIAYLELGDSLHVKDLDFENLKFTVHEDVSIANVILPRVAAADAAAEAEAEAAALEAEAALEVEEGAEATDESPTKE